MNLIMMGPPGAGKGTQAERFARGRGVPKISTGDILRDAVQEGTEVGRRARAIMDQGDLVSDEVMIAIVRERLTRADTRNGFVLDGFPRTVAQARALDQIVGGRGPLIVVDVVVPELELARRLRSRRICSSCGANAGGFESDDLLGVGPVTSPAVALGDELEAEAVVNAQEQPNTCRRCGGTLVMRSDDSEDVLVERLKVYTRDTKPLVDFYRKRPTFRSINGAQPVDRVAADLAEAVESAMEMGSRPPARRSAERSL